MTEIRKHARETSIVIPPEEIDKVAEMAKGDSFSLAVQTLAIFGINTAYDRFKKEQEDKPNDK